MSNYYDWNKTLSYDAEITCVIGARGIGKTYGIRLQAIRDHIKHGYRFVEVVRHVNEIEGTDAIQANYFDRIADNNEFEGYIFKCIGKLAYIAKKPEGDKDKPSWELLGYFVALTKFQRAKERTFSRVRRIIFDEALLERRSDRWHNYLPNEIELLSSVVNSCARERADTDSVKPRVYLLGNACDLVNPYFARWKIGDMPKRGYTWRENKTFLLHYVENAETPVTQDSVASHIAGAGAMSDMAILNEFLKQDDAYFGKKPARAKLAFAIVHNRNKYGVWLDAQEGYYYVTPDFPKTTSAPVYALTADDARPNYVIAKRAQKALRGFTELYYMGIVKYKDHATREGFLNAMKLYGIY